MENLTIDIITAESSLLVGVKADSVTAPGIEGTFQVLPGHTTFLTELDTGPVTVEGAEGTKQFVVSGGFAEVMQGHVRILADQAEAFTDLDATQIDETLKKVEVQLSEAEPLSAEADLLRVRQKFLTMQRELCS